MSDWCDCAVSVRAGFAAAAAAAVRRKRRRSIFVWRFEWTMGVLIVAG